MTDTKVTALTALTSASDDDILYIVDDPAGTPTSKKITKADLKKGTLAEYNTSLTDDNFASLAGVETITGAKTFGSAGAVGKLKVAGTTSGSTIIDATATAGSGTVTLPTTGTLATLTGVNSQKETFAFACSDETTALTAATGKVEFQMPYAFTVTEVFATVTTAATGATLLTIDINEAGTTIISTKITLDASEKTSRTAATPPVISDSSLANSAVMTIDIDAVGNTIAGAGLKVYIVGYQT